MNAMEAAKHALLEVGTNWILLLLGVLSFISVAIIVERAMYFRARAADLQDMAMMLDRHLSAGDIAGALAQLSQSRTVAAAVAAAGLRLADRGPTSVEKAMASAVALQRGQLERGLAYLGTLGNNAPFVGLFGTVVGVVAAFDHLGTGAEGAPGSQVASQLVMGAISEALVATAVGILVALPAVAAYNYFQRRVTGLLQGSDVLGNLVLAYLCDDSVAHKGGPHGRQQS
jgi:biopolymer transport protein ExbB